MGKKRNFGFCPWGEIPDGINPPVLINSTSSSLHLNWSIPKYPSGNITAYIIRSIDGSKENVLYFGLQTNFLFGNLRPLTNYTLVLEACNQIGCGRSPQVSYSTSEMAPLSVQTPLVLKITHNAIIIKWFKPTNDQIQFGFLKNYILFFNDKEYVYNLTSFNISICKECASNIKELINLIPGIKYEIVLSACTNGGCTNSSLLEVRTLESEPDTSDIKIEMINRTSNSIYVKWNRPSRPNGLLNKYILSVNDKIVYEGDKNEFHLQGLMPNTFYFFVVQFCNFFSCNSTEPIRFRTDEAIPEGSIVLDAQAKGSNQIELKWYSNPMDPLKPNGNIYFSVYVTGPFLLESNLGNLIELFKNNSKIIQIQTLNLLNTTVLNTKYGILDRVLANSNYDIQVNASNSKGFLLSNKISVQTLKSNPELIIPPQLTYANSTCLKIEWSEPLLLNSDDTLIYYSLIYRKKIVWNEDGPIDEPKYETEIITLFSNSLMTNFYILHHLIPFTAYSFQLTAGNSYGESKSQWSQDIYTLESSPQNQSPPQIINFTSNSVLVKFTQAQVPNGFINLFKINVFKFTNELIHLGLITLKNDTKTFNITHLEPFTYYLFTIASCNSIGCAQSSYDKFNLSNNNYIQTLPDRPQEIREPILTSPNSYSIEIKWYPPFKPNGLLQYYILERVDYINSNSSSRKYKFRSSRLNFLDDNDLESCGFYSYRIFAFNQIGFTVSNYVNITVSSSKPLIVHAPIISLINTSTARFEWTKPLTLCNITKYTLTLRNESKTLSFDLIDSKIVITHLSSFTVYRVSLSACVTLISDSCASSLVKNFRTPGFIPQGLSRPIVKLISPKVVSVEWLEPEFKNGEFLTYQVIRLNLNLNRTENLYSGQDLYFLDLSTKNLNSYRYRLIFINEFGSSISEWSDLIQIETNEPLIIDNKIRYNFNMFLECPTANFGFLKWIIQPNEILIFLKKLFNSVNSISFNSLNIIFNDLNISVSNSLEFNEKLIHLNESSFYAFELMLEIRTNSGLTYYLISERKTCNTPSKATIFGDTRIKFIRKGTYLTIDYNLNEAIVRNYNQFGLKLSKEQAIIDSKNFTQTSGELQIGPVRENEIYFLTLWACRLNFCIDFEPLVYSLSTRTPQGISNLYATLNESTSVILNWQPVLQPNGFGIRYLIYRRLACTLENPNNYIECPNDKICCGPNIYEYKPGFQCCADFFYVPVPIGQICCSNSYTTDIGYNIGEGDACCGDTPFVNNSSQKCCNLNLQNQKPNQQNQCAIFPTEILTECDEFHLISNQTQLTYIDEYLNASNTYEYNLCVENSYGQSCSSDTIKIKTNVTPPDNFTIFNFLILNEKSAYFYWSEPIFPNEASIFYILLKDSIEIYKGDNLNYEDKNLLPYQTYLYTLKACNSAGCTINKNKKIVTTFPKKPTDSPNIFLVNKSHSNFTLEWKLPIYQIEKFIFIMYEIDLELEILFNFESNSTSLTKSARNINEENFFYFSSRSLLESNSTYQITITDLKANLIYSYELIACNLAGCSRSRKGQIKTNSFEIQNFNSPIPYALNESSIELIWWDPENLNGDLESFTIFRNDVAIFSTLPDKSEFYTFKDLNLQPNRVYYYKIQVSNGFFKLNTSQVNIRTPMDSKFTITKCINGNTNLKDGAINFLNILHINTTGISSNYINFSYDNSEWNNFISCLDKSLSFSIKIIVLSQEKSVQTLDFPYPNTTNSVIRFKIPGLKSNTKYLIRILINSNFPIIKSLVTDSILVKTLPTKPSGIFAEPIIQKNLYSNSISIKWKRPSGLIDMYEVQWIFSNCTSRQFENILLNLSVVNSSFFYDETNEIFVYRHKENSNFIFNSVKILGVNSYGSIESREIEFLTRGSQPKPVFDLRVSQVYSTGIKIKFKNNNFYLKYFVINLEPLNERIPNRSHEIFYPVTTECKIYNPYEIVINGLEPYTLFNLTIKAISYSGLESNLAEYLIINTLESTPKFLKPLSFEPKSTSILIKLIDPGQINGILKQFFVYHENKLIYSGTNREFLFDNLQPFTNYSIKYEVCTSMGCTRYKNELISQTLESLPEDLERPQVDVLNECFNLKLKRPKRMNGIYRYTEIYRLSKSFGNNQFIDEILRIQTNETQFKDCDLTPNILYSYRIVVFNSIGGITSEYTESLPIILLKPFNFIKMNATQLNETLIRLDFTKPQSYSDSLVYKIFRDSNLISTIYENKSLYLEFYDSYDFLPDTFVKYNIFACNLVGCSSDDNYSIFIKTKNTPPFLVYRPILIDIGSDWVKIDASLSVVLRQSQKIVEYRFFLNDVLVNQGLDSNIILENLIPNTQYKINLEVCTFFDDGCLRSKDYLYFKTLQALPVLNFEPTCQSGVKDLFIKWPLVNQEVNFYNIKHRLNNLDYLMSKLDGTKNEVLIENLIPMTRYDIFVEGCNQAGCGLSKIKTCQTLKYLPVNITIEIIQLDSSNLIKWSFENNFDNENYEFNLWRSVLLNSSLVYDSSFRPIDKSLKVVYTGSEMSFDDKDINFFTEYEYSIEINTIYGKVKSQGYRVRTRSHEPQLLILIGSIRNVYNDSVQLMIRPPLKMNGILQRIYILIKTGYIEDQREILHQKLDGLNEVELINFLDSVNLNGLLSESIYELKTRFCNQISCITSLQTIKFKTLANERIQFFDAFSLDQGSINFKWEFKKSDPWRRVRFQLRYLGGGSSLLMYEGFENSFIFQTAKSMLIYEFELLALDGQNSIIDRKSVSVKTLSEKSQEDEYPQISLQPFDNQTTIMNIKWDYFAKRTASPTRIKYELLVNNFKLYSGNLINHKQILTFDECLRLLNQTTEFNIQIKAFFNQNIYLAEPIKIPFNCSIKQLEQKLQNFNYKNIFVVFFIILIFLLTLTIFLIYCCINKYRSSKFEPSLSPSLSTLSINSSLQNMFMEKNKSFLSISHSIYNNNNTNSVISSPNPVLERSQI
ncbi:unnamed protein product [Brachionus calyciflorus]|uniref:Fibronectin type-III domain-containing protein n=1 Tax=Brachionus calyciflorus TaxID=104777 RepID=A0A813WC35_9BILA|nr:unnamed protein product [Brachionus calyciflorus]